MNQPGTLMEIVRYWFDQAEESLLSAQAELSAGRLSFAVNRIDSLRVFDASNFAAYREQGSPSTGK